MTASFKHTFQSAKADGTDNTLLQPSSWNAEHTVTAGANTILGNATNSSGAVSDISCTAQGRSILAAATLADLIAAGIPLFSTGDMKPTIKTAADTGWVMLNDGTIGNDTSGATNLASTANALALYTLIWNNISNSWAPIQDSAGTPTTRGGSASADFAASKRLPLPAALGRVLGVAGAGSGLTSRALGQTLGEETHLLSTGEMPIHGHAVNEIPHSHGLLLSNIVNTGQSGNLVVTSGGSSVNTAAATTGISLQNAGGNLAHNNMQPTAFVNWMIKL